MKELSILDCPDCNSSNIKKLIGSHTKSMYTNAKNAIHHGIKILDIAIDARMSQCIAAAMKT